MELQCFLSFANLYQWFIKGYSTTAAPLTTLLIKGPKSIIWNNVSQTSLHHKPHILRHPNPERPFMVEADASKTGVVAMLSQHSGFIL